MIDLGKYGYYGADPKPVFNTSFYRGEDLYSDGDIENEVIKIIAANPTTDYEEAISRNYSWPVFYHLTRIRQNLLNWYPFKEQSDVLEIGCGMGAITELLCKKCNSVTAVELSKRRATATYLRCREYDNLEIIVGNLNDIEFEKKYDYITLIGVLEYQNNFTSSSNPFKDFLAKIKQLLKPEGKLIIAIENKYGLTMKNSGLGVGVPDIGRCTLYVKGQKVYINTSAACIGQGMGTVVTQIVCNTTGLFPSLVVHSPPDTETTPNSGNTTASRQTVFTGEATRQAALKLKKALKNATLEELEGEKFEGEFSFKTDAIGSELKNPVSHIAYGYATHLVVLDNNGVLKKVVAAHDVGRAINPHSLEGQIEGGVVMSLGYALTENYPLENSVPTAKFGTLGLFKSPNVPEIETIIVEKNDEKIAYGAKGVGEICSIPTPPAVALAYYKYDGKFRTVLPLSNTPYSKK